MIVLLNDEQVKKTEVLDQAQLDAVSTQLLNERVALQDEVEAVAALQAPHRASMRAHSKVIRELAGEIRTGERVELVKARREFDTVTVTVTVIEVDANGDDVGVLEQRAANSYEISLAADIAG